MSWHFLPELEAEFSEAFFLDGEPVGEGGQSWESRIVERTAPNADSSLPRQQQGRWGRKNGKDQAKPRLIDWWTVDCFSRVDNGVAHRVDRVRATGNGQVPAVARLAWETLK